MEHILGEEELDDDGRQRESVVGEDAGEKHVQLGDGAHVEAAKDALLAKRHQSGAESPKATHNV